MLERPILFSGPMVRAIQNGTKTQTRRVVKCPHKPWKGQVYNAASWTVLPHSGGGWRATQHADDGRIVAEFGPAGFPCPYGAPGDRLWVREKWQYADWTEEGEPYVRYAADNAVIGYFGNDAPEDEKLVATWEKLSRAENYEIDNKAADRRWRPSLFLPRWASRLALTITDVRVERLKDVSEADAVAEGCIAGEPMTEVDIECLRGTNEYELAKLLGVGSYPTAKFNYSMLWDEINGNRAPWYSNPWVWVVSFARFESEVER